MVCALVISCIPIKGTFVFVKTSVSAISKKIEPHHKHREGREAGINEGDLSSFSVISAPPRHDSVAHLGHHGGEIFG